MCNFSEKRKKREKLATIIFGVEKKAIYLQSKILLIGIR